MLGEDEKPVIRSGFRSALPVAIDNSRRLQQTETRLNKHMNKIVTFAKNRTLKRNPFLTEIINAQIQDESSGILVESLRLDVFNPEA